MRKQTMASVYDIGLEELEEENFNHVMVVDPKDSKL